MRSTYRLHSQKCDRLIQIPQSLQLIRLLQQLTSTHLMINHNNSFANLRLDI
ncbi:hypothetical protein NIES39_A00190 [Arthrospira platensis NIES-39]|nr:hypothetical protein NIES39_A00190 [Arthrospira platensis NIES-39]